jgi:hypothetical protein
MKSEQSRDTYNLVLDGHNAEVHDLHRGPNQPVSLQGWNINVLELALHSALSTTLSDGHESEEASKTSRCEEELIESHALQSRQPSRSLTHRESRRQKLEPPVLQRRHDETIGHESNGSLEIKRWREELRVGNQVGIVDRVPPVQFVDLNREEIIFVWTSLLAYCALSDSGQCLRYCVCDATQHLCLCQPVSILYAQCSAGNCQIDATWFEVVDVVGKHVCGDAQWQERSTYSVGDHRRENCTCCQYVGIASFALESYLVFVHSSYCTCGQEVRQPPFGGERLRRGAMAVRRHCISQKKNHASVAQSRSQFSRRSSDCSVGRALCAVCRPW